MAIGLVLLIAAVLALDQRARDRRHPARPGNDLVENHGADPEAGAERLGLGHVTEIVVGDLGLPETLAPALAFWRRPVVT